MTERLAMRILLGLGIVLLSFWVARELGELINRFGQVLALFFSAWMISFVLGPPAAFLQRLRLSRPVAVLIVYTLFFGLFVVAGFIFVPVVVDQLNRLRLAVEAYGAQSPALLTWFEERAKSVGLSDADLREVYRSLVTQAQAITAQALQNALGWITGALSVLVSTVFCLIISVYLLLDGPSLLHGLRGLLPERYRAEADAMVTSIAENFGGYIRGQVILSSIYGLAVGLTMLAIGLEFQFVSALFAGIALVIPFVGPFVSLAPALLVAVLTRPGDAWWIALVLIISQQVVLNVAGPRVFGHTVNMHPLVVIGSAMAGAALAGLWGALFGIPVAGIISSAVRRAYDRTTNGADAVAPGPGGGGVPDDLQSIDSAVR